MLYHDNIPAKVLKIAAGHISQSLSCVINSSLETGIFPDRWKTAKISCISKGNANRVLTTNYKICESCVNNQLQEHDIEFETFRQLNQYAYTKHSSTTTALIQVIDSFKIYRRPKTIFSGSLY